MLLRHEFQRRKAWVAWPTRRRTRQGALGRCPSPRFPRPSSDAPPALGAYTLQRGYIRMRPVERHALASFVAAAAFVAGTALASASTLVANVPQAAGMRDLGAAAASINVRLTLVLNYRNEAQLDQLLDEQGDETSPLYQRFLTQQQFRDAFAPTAQTYAQTLATLRHEGLTVVATWPGNRHDDHGHWTGERRRPRFPHRNPPGRPDRRWHPLCQRTPGVPAGRAARDGILRSRVR